MKHIKTLFYIPILLLLSYCCKPKEKPEKPDTERPKVELLYSVPEGVDAQICGATEPEVFMLMSSDTLVLDLRFSDNQELSQYKIDIHHNFDCHGHRTAQRLGEPWFVVQIKELHGKISNVTEKLKVPENVAAGDYHIMIFCTDKEGNEADPLVHSIKIENIADREPPAFTLSSPLNNHSAERGSTITFEGTATDNHSLNNGRVEIYYYNSSGVEFTAAEEYFSADAGTSEDFSVNFTVPLSSEQGPHNFKVRVFDELNNFLEENITINFI
ncbi:DUF4625 domain-containing protein [Cytophagaceae bacterium ABcell3]|nr:DUF4625 domain-containing protein [Cytophagaceae bacterium ABcell3]